MNQLSLLEFSQLPANPDQPAQAPEPATVPTEPPSPDPEPPLVKIRFPGEKWLAVPAGCWQRLATGEIEVSYRDKEELALSIQISMWVKGLLEAPDQSAQEQLNMFADQSKHNYSEWL